MQGRQLKVGPYLDNFNVVLEEEAVGHGGHPEVVNLVSPGAALPHLGAHHAVRVDHLRGADTRILIQARNLQAQTLVNAASAGRRVRSIDLPKSMSWRHNGASSNISFDDLASVDNAGIDYKRKIEDRIIKFGIVAICTIKKLTWSSRLSAFRSA